MLETIRQYGQEKLQDSQEYMALRMHHLEYFLQFTETATSRLLGVEQKKWFMELDADYENIRAALEYAMEVDIKRAARLTVILGPYWEVRGRITEGRRAVERALVKSKELPNQLRAMALRWQAKFAARQGDYASAWGPLEESLKLSREAQDKPGLLAALHDLGMVHVLRGNYASAKHSYQESLAIAKEIDDKREIAALTTSLGNVASYVGDPATARQYQEQSVTLFRKLGDKLGLFIALNNLGLVLESQGDHPAARQYYEESIATAYEIGEKNLVAYALNGLAHLLYLDGEAQQADRYYRESLLISREIGEKRCVAYCLEGFARLAVRSGNALRAARLFGAAETIRRAIGSPLNQAEQAELDEDLAFTRAELGDSVFASLLDEGHALTLEQCIPLALEDMKS
jgi:non-specific serine/threonine protein kinase